MSRPSRSGRTSAPRGRRTSPPRTSGRTTKPRGARELSTRDLVALRDELETAVAKSEVPRWSVDPDDARRSVARLVLALVDFVRQLLERQAIRRMDAGTLTSAQVEAVGTALMELEKTVHDLARKFDLDPRDLKLDLGPLGRLT